MAENTDTWTEADWEQYKAEYQAEYGCPYPPQPEKKYRDRKEYYARNRESINEKRKKDYASLKGLRSLDFVLLFMPIEAAFMAAFQADEKLFNDAFEHKIVVVTPTTL